MEIKDLTPEFSVTAQIAPTDLAAAKAQGFKAIICNRPDGEGEDQPSFASIKAAAEKAGLQARYIPVQPGMMDESHIAAFAEAMRDLPKPVLGYCRSGARAGILFDAWREAVLRNQQTAAE